MLTGNNGIISQALKAKEKFEKGVVKEAIELAYTQALMNSENNNNNSISITNELKKNGYIDAYVTGDDKAYIVTINDSSYKIDKSGKVTEYEVSTLVEMYNKAIEDNCINEDGKCRKDNHLHIGDYLNYKNPESGTYIVESGKLGIDEEQIYDVTKKELNWRVMGIDSSTGGIKIVASVPMLGKIPNTGRDYLEMKGAKGWINAVTELNNICELYTTSYGNARSITLKDIDELVGIMSQEKKRNDNSFSYINILDAINFGETYGPVNNQYTPEGFLNGITSTIQGTTTAYCYFAKSEDNNRLDGIYMPNLRKHKMLYDNTMGILR